MTSRPAAPFVEVDPELLVYWRTFPKPSNEVLACDLIESLQRQLALAQTEIKGHMRVEDELRAEAAALKNKLDDIVNTMKSSGMKVPGWIEHTGQDGKLRRDNLTVAATLMFELEARQSRIAELEKRAEALQEFLKSRA